MTSQRVLKSNTVSFTVDELAESEPLVAAVERILSLNSDDEQVVLDFSALEFSSAHRIRPFNLLLLANVVGATAHRPALKLVLPADDNARLLVLRSGLLFSLATRKRAVSASDIDGLTDARLASRWLEIWKRPWSPVQPTLGRLFDDEPRPVDDRAVLSNPRNAKRATRIIVDPHLLSREALMHHASQGLAGAWLSSVVPDSSNERRREARDMWQGLVTSRVLGEPLINLPDHASTRPNGSPALNRQVHSLVLLARTDGGGDVSYPRLHALISDNGYGLVSTLRPALRRPGAPVREAEMANASAIDVLKFALTRPAKNVNDPSLPWARETFGIAVGAMDDRFLGDVEFTVITGDEDNGNDAVWASVPSSGRGEDVTTGVVAGVPFVGTTVFACLPMPHMVDNAEAAKDDD